MLWTTFFMSLMVYYLLASWLPTVIKESGMTLELASYYAMLLQIGGAVGAITIGLLMDRKDPHHVLGVYYTLAAVFIAFIGSAGASGVMLALAVFGAGFGLAGAQIGMGALAAGFYPTANRATGVSWANGVGRFGSGLGAIVGGFLLSLHLGLPITFVIIAVPVVIAAIAVLIKGRIAPQPVHQHAVASGAPATAGAARK